MNVGTKFRLIGRQTIFVAVKLYDAAGFIPSVIGYTLDGKLQTAARIVDAVVLA